MNRTLEEMLRAFCGDESRQHLWEDYIHILEFEFNNAVNSSTGFSPFYLWYGQHPHTPATVAVNPNPPTYAVPGATADFLKRIDEAVSCAQASIARAQRTMKEYYDKKRSLTTFAVGDMVFVEKWGLPEQRRGNKLSPLRHGPWKVTAQIGPNAYRLDTPATWNMHNVFHASFLTPHKPHREGTPASVLGVRTYRNQRQLHIRYKEFGPESDVWLPEVEVRTKFPHFFVDWLRSAGAGGFYKAAAHTVTVRYLGS